MGSSKKQIDNGSNNLRYFFIEKIDIPPLSQLQLLFGSKSLFALHEDFFIKILMKKPFVHNVLIKYSTLLMENPFTVDLYKYSPILLAYKELSRAEILFLTKKTPRLTSYLKNVKTAHLYVFERRELIKISHLLQQGLLTLDKELVMKLMKTLIYTVNLLQTEGFTYHDLCDENLLWDLRTEQPFLIDLDSAIPNNFLYDEAKKLLEGQHTYHRVYLYLRKRKELKKKFRDLKLFGSCLIFNYFLAIIGTYFTKKYQMMNYYAQELPQVLFLKTKPTSKELKLLLQNPRVQSILQRSLNILRQTIEEEQPSLINALLGIIELL